MLRRARNAGAAQGDATPSRFRGHAEGIEARRRATKESIGQHFYARRKRRRDADFPGVAHAAPRAPDAASR